MKTLIASAFVALGLLGSAAQAAPYHGYPDWARDAFERQINYPSHTGVQPVPCKTAPAPVPTASAGATCTCEHFANAAGLFDWCETLGLERGHAVGRRHVRARLA